MKKSKRLKISLPALTSIEDVEKVVGEISLTYLNQVRIAANMGDEIATVKKRYEGILADCQALLDRKTESLRAWAEANPEAFDGKKSITFIHGSIGFRTGTPKLALLNRRWTWDTALDAVLGLLPNFIRSKPEIDKEALIAQREEPIIAQALPKCGLKVTQGETFYVDPDVPDLESRQTATSEAA